MGQRIREILVEVLLYGAFVALYAVVVLRWLDKRLTALFHRDLLTYAVLCLILIVAQGVLLDVVTSFLLERLGLGRPR